MSSRRFLLLVSVFAAARAAGIPVKVVYERSGHHFGNRNLDERVQVPHDDLLKMKISEDIFREEASHGVRNLAEKIQLSPDERGQVVKHLPDAMLQEEIAKPEEKPEEEKPVPEQPSNAANLISLLKKAEEIVYNGIANIRNNLSGENFTKPSQEAWEKLNQTLGELFQEQYKLALKQDKPPENNQNQGSQNFIQTIQQNFNNFLQNFQNNNNQNNKPNGSEDEQTTQQQQGPFQNFFNQMGQGFTQIINNMNNLNNQNGQNATGQEDPQTVNQGTNPFNGFITNIQNFFGGANQGNSPSQGANSTQGDTGTGSQNQNQGPGQFFQNIGQSISNAFSQGNFFGQQSTSKPPNSEDEGTQSSTQAPNNNNFIQNIGNAFNNVNNIFRPQTTQKPASGGDTGGDSSNNNNNNNPITSGINQFQQLVGGQQGGNPVESIQNAISGGIGGAGSGSSTEKSKTENDEKTDDGAKPIAEEGGKNEIAQPDQEEKKEKPKETKPETVEMTA